MKPGPAPQATPALNSGQNLVGMYAFCFPDNEFHLQPSSVSFGNGFFRFGSERCAIHKAGVSHLNDFQVEIVRFIYLVVRFRIHAVFITRLQGQKKIILMVFVLQNSIPQKEDWTCFLRL